MQDSSKEYPLKNKIQELLVSSGIEKIACYNQMLDPEHWDYYRVDLFGGIV